MTAVPWTRLPDGSSPERLLLLLVAARPTGFRNSTMSWVSGEVLLVGIIIRDGRLPCGSNSVLPVFGAVHLE